jgi:glutamate dehydrogenase/leucine dehydrogenase
MEKTVWKSFKNVTTNLGRGGGGGIIRQKNNVMWWFSCTVLQSYVV